MNVTEGRESAENILVSPGEHGKASHEVFPGQAKPRFIRALQPSYLHMYRAVCSSYFVFIRRLLRDIIRGLLLVRHSLLHPTNERY